MLAVLMDAVLFTLAALAAVVGRDPGVAALELSSRMV